MSRQAYPSHPLVARTNISQTYELVVGALALITAFAFALIPFFMAYRPVALGAPWDIVLMVLWGAAFGLMKAIFLRSYSDSDEKFEVVKYNKDDFVNHWNTMVSSAYINLAGLVLFLISGVMGIILIFVGKKSSKVSYV